MKMRQASLHEEAAHKQQSFEALMATKKLEQGTFETTWDKQEHDSAAPSYKSGGIVSKMQKDSVKKHSECIGFQMGLYVENSNENEVTESEDDNEKEDGKRWRRKIEEVKGKQ